MSIGFDQPLYILPFDHRGSFQKKMFGWDGPLTAVQAEEIACAKRVVYDGFLAAVQRGVPRARAGILVDEQFGSEILLDAADDGFITCCPAEKSGQEEFDFEYREYFADHIDAYRPTFCKVLVRYNPEGDAVLNGRQAARLKRLSDYLRGKTGRSRLMFELLVPAEDAQMHRLNGDRKSYDLEMRPRLMANAIEELWDCGVEPDVWKKASMGALIVNALLQPLEEMGGIPSFALFSATAKTVRGSGSGWLPPPARASSDLRWAGRFSGIRSLPGLRTGFHGPRRYRRSRGDISNVSRCSRHRASPFPPERHPASIARLEAGDSGPRGLPNYFCPRDRV